MASVVKPLIVAAALAASPALAAPTTVDWSSITGSVVNSDGTTTTSATMDVGGTNVDVTYTGNQAFVQTATSGGYYWTEGSPKPYTGGQYDAGSGYVAGETLADAPGDNSLIAVSSPTLETITFSKPVSDVYMALVSWNGDGIANFSAPFSLVSSGQGAYGTGSFSNVSSTGFTGSGELHGVIKFTGPISTLTFDTTGDEYWHGFLIGTASLAAPAVPEPAGWAMMLGGVGLLGGALRRAYRRSEDRFTAKVRAASA